ncbi:putative electron transporter [Tripterygium wilfordii]|uniref:Putative electron transporter n=1 Tax=Tripterygium wilfordii TaxID=458696 RepID=A0A7J7E345_TRIWF|nr:uncharacterized protein LOC120003287 [Tripterygium wilfordii]KAF5752941.1 putative electron transporter [Tripterygium wilfordii]
MVLEGSGDSNMWGLRVTSRHKRSKSFPDKRRVEGDGLDDTSRCIKLDMGQLKDSIKSKKKLSDKAKVQTSLKEEILQLEKRLQDQFKVRNALEKALGYKTASNDITNEAPMPKPAAELIKEIAVLELEVVYLEQYLLSLYRKAFDQQISSVSPSSNDERLKSPVRTPRGKLLGISRLINNVKRENPAIQSGFHSLENPLKDANGTGREEKLLDSSVNRCHSSLSQHRAFSGRTSPPEDSLGKAVRACHSQPLSMMEYAQNASNIISLAEHLGTRISDHVPDTPNKLSEDMIRCMSAIYCKLADPPLMNNGLSSPNSSISSMSVFSPQDQCETWSPRFGNNSSFDVRLDNPFHVEGLKEFSGPYSRMVEVPCIYRDSQKLGDVENLLQSFRSLVCRLEEADPRKLKHEEKLAFWINIHNALVMHAILAYGVPQNSVKRLYLLLKAAYNIGGHTVSANTIQSTILGCRMSRPSQWIRLLLSSKTKFKTGDERQAYAIEHPEPLLHFALSSGNHSDPAVRMYTPKRVFQELEIAKDDYIRASFGIQKGQKIVLPKVVESFAKDSDLCQAGIMEMIQQSLPESLRKSVKKCQLGKSHKSIEWIPHNFTFRYLISKELVR